MGKNKIIVLSRVSTGRQTLEQQTESILKEVRNLGYDEQHTIIIEDKESAISLDEQERHGLNMMKEYIENDKSINAVICYEVSRLSRRPKVLYSIRDYLIERKIQLIIQTPYMRLLDDEGKMSQTANILFSLFSSISESEMMIKKERMIRGKHKKMNDNIFCGSACAFGYKFDENKKLTIDEKNSKTVIKIFNLYSQGWSTRKIAKELFETGELKCEVEEACRSVIVKALSNRKYIGDNGKGYYKYMPIISTELFNKCREIAKANISKPKTKISMVYYCKGIICNGKDNRVLSPCKGNAVYQVYNEIKHNSISININVVDALIWDVVSEWVTYHAPDENKLYKKQLKNAIQTLNKKISNSIENKGELLKQIGRIEKRIIVGKLDEIRGDKMQDEINLQIKEIDKQIDNWLDEINLKEVELSNIKSDFIFSQNLNILNDEEKYELIRKTVSKIILWKTNKRGTYDCDIQFVNGIIKSYKILSQSKHPRFWNEYGEELNIDVPTRILKSRIRKRKK